MCSRAYRIYCDRYRSQSHPTPLVRHIFHYFANCLLILPSVPPNCKFEVDDAENDWSFSESFDYIHARAIVTCFKDNRAMVQKIFDNLKPGGYFEFQDPCFPMLSDDKTLNGTALEEYAHSTHSPISVSSLDNRC
ncbi:MAG: hypothetical protein CL912_01485 [Deltaproteobacteria bacterium]|nr:hypothetical protein [Deltaproteobacteria bacterium]